MANISNDPNVPNDVLLLPIISVWEDYPAHFSPPNI